MEEKLSCGKKCCKGYLVVYNDIMNSKNILIGVVVIIFLGAGAYFLLTQRTTITPPNPTPTPTPVPASLGAELGAQTENPAASLPETNPFREAQTNPFDGANTNPFQNTFNPFE